MAGYRLASNAVADLRGIRTYTRERWGGAQATRYVTQLRDRMRWLAASSDRGRRRADLGKGLFSYPEGSHIIYFRWSEAVLEVVRVLHHRMDPLRHL